MRAHVTAAALLLGLLTPSLGWGQSGPGPSMIPPTAGPPVAPEPAAPPGPPAAPAPAPAPAAPPASDSATPPGFYVESAPAEAAPAPAPNSPSPPIFEPPPPGAPAIYEPVPPPVPHHRAPRTALWVGARLGWFVPFGSAYAHGVRDPDGFLILAPVPWKNYVSSGPAFELDAGVRLARAYNLFGLWQRAELGSGSVENDLYGGQKGGDTDYFAVGLRASSDADSIGLVTELAIGYRQARAVWNDGTELRMTGGVLEGRIGVGADIRLSSILSLSPLLELGVGSFDRLRRVTSTGASYDQLGVNDAPGSHGWVTLGIGGHADLLGGK